MVQARRWVGNYVDKGDEEALYCDLQGILLSLAKVELERETRSCFPVTITIVLDDSDSWFDQLIATMIWRQGEP